MVNNMETTITPKNEHRVFIGSSSEGKEIAEYLQLALDDYCEAVIWDQGVFTLSAATLQSLTSATQNYDFAILVLTPDDQVLKRGNLSNAARDNVLFELGLFMGKLGPSSTFIVHCRDDKLEFPSDLAGITRVTYRHRSDGNLQAAINPVAVKIRKAMAEVARDRVTTVPNSDVKEGLMAGLLNESYFSRYICDSLEALADKRMGISTHLEDVDAFYTWSNNLLGMLRDLYSKRCDDAYSAWMRPTIETPTKLKVFQEHNMPKEYKPYEFQLDEGLAGKVWNTGATAATSKLRKHPWWVFRGGCLTDSYVCVPVGKPKGSGGVLAVGSFRGFDVSDSDLEVVKIFASVLAIIEAPLPSGKGG
jgi:uncharacterized protein YgfB (UPF0149 family)